ncbi:MAG: S-adenosylmethionine decarboxylase [Polyangiaceae bacterium]|nr:S-adenosylmethionine decarboxylase [Polyangiaceae bacterium]
MSAPLHLSLCYAACDADTLTEAHLRSAARAAFEAMGWRAALSAHRWEPQGLSLMLVADEATLILHTWPELGCVLADLMLLTGGDAEALMRAFGEHAALPGAAVHRSVRGGT